MVGLHLIEDPTGTRKQRGEGSMSDWVAKESMQQNTLPIKGQNPVLTHLIPSSNLPRSSYHKNVHVWDSFKSTYAHHHFITIHKR